ncbi:SdpI family protein [Glutamicibacter protophormiae]|uniref:SdpI family protein n=1 Tax=Glutamicibacter protophormiae TaxID=37930 RepID=UPI00331971C0
MTMHQGYLPMTFILPLLMLASALTCRACAAGRITRNHWAGYRLPALFASDEAWRAGHAACTLLLGPVFLRVELPAFALALAWAMIRAVRAAKHAPA